MEPIENFRGVIADYDVIPYVLVPAIAKIFPWIEVIFGSFMILGYAPRLSSFVLGASSFGFLMLFAVTYLIHGSLPGSCGCFGEGGVHLTVPQVFVLDTVNFLLAMKLLLMSEHPFSLDKWLRRSS